MSWTVFALVLLAALLHASWNALVKRGRDKRLDTVAIVAGAAAIALLVLPTLPAPAAASWPYLAGSAAIHVVYFAGVVASYRAGDLGLVYPVMRGLAPVLVGIGGAAVVGETLALAGWAGIALVSAGVLVLAWPRAAPGGASTARALAYALGTAVLIALYTIIDGLGARLSGSPGAYVLWMLLGTGAAMTAYALARDGRVVAAHLRGAWGLAAGGGAMLAAAYGLVLWAMTAAPIALVAALRESSVILAALIGTVLLGEPFGRRRLLGAALVAAGAAALKLG
ncbi:MAG: DMT family transporter [Burkholderiales bacterium]|nr:DMT family transporter [Burkholderiales bacterium]